MGNICFPKKLVFNKNLEFSKILAYKSVEKVSRLFSEPSKIDNSVFAICESSSQINKYEEKSNIDSNFHRCRTASDDSETVICRAGSPFRSHSEHSMDSNCQFDKLSDSSEEDMEVQNVEDDFDSETENIEKRLRKLCFEVNHHDETVIAQIQETLQMAYRCGNNHFIDIQDDDGNTPVCIAVLRNNIDLLNCLLRFMPDFPSYVRRNNSFCLLLQVAAHQIPYLSDGSNLLTVILKLWIVDNNIHSVAAENIMATPFDSDKTIFHILLDEIHKSSIEKSKMLETHLINLDLLLQLYRILFEEHLNEIRQNRDIFHVCTIVSNDQIGLTDHRKENIIKSLQRSPNVNYFDIIRNAYNHEG